MLVVVSEARIYVPGKEKPMSYAGLLNELMLSPVESTIRNLCKEGVDREILLAALKRLSDLEELRPGGRRQKDLKDTLDCVIDTKRALIRTFRPSAGLHTMIQALEPIAARIRQDLEPWDRKHGKRGRGRSPQTPILVALMSYFLKVTKSLHDEELAELASGFYKMAGSDKEYKEGSLRKLWQLNSDLHENWRSILKLHPPVLGKAHAPGRRFKPSKTSAKRVLGPQSRPKYVN
jgi:hypothetical protein